MAIKIERESLQPSDPSLPALAVEITCLVESYMVWVGIKGDANHLCKDWACAIPNGAATSLYRSSSSDVALSMAQRLANRFKKQIFMSVDIANSSLVIEAEKGIVKVMKRIESQE